MEHLRPFLKRSIIQLDLAEDRGWRLKRYAILANGRDFDAEVATAASNEAFKRLPKAGTLSVADDNHGIGIQIIHFAQVAVVSPVFYWQWGSVLAQMGQMRASWEKPTVFEDGVSEVVGCIWELNVVRFEVESWTKTLLGPPKPLAKRVSDYLSTYPDQW